MVKTFKESDARDVEKLAADRLRETDKKVKDCHYHSEAYCTVHGRTYLCSVNSWHVPDGGWGILPVHPTHQTDESLRGWCSTYCVYSAKMRICRPISEHVQPGAALYQRRK
jgi:hypothetical protein